MFSLYSRFKLSVVIGANKVFSFKMKDGQLERDNKTPRKMPGFITEIYVDQIFKTGTFMTISKENLELDSEETHVNETIGHPVSSNIPLHCVYNNTIDKARKDVKTDEDFQLLHV